MLHPILQEVRRRGIITAIRTQPELVRVRDTHGVTGVHANQRVFERGGEIRRPFTARGDRNGRLSGLFNDAQNHAVRPGVVGVGQFGKCRGQFFWAFAQM